MAWNADRNRIFAERMKAFAVAEAALAEEAQRLRTVFIQQLQSDPVTFVDTAIATKAEIVTAQSYLTDFLVFHNGGGALGNTTRGTAWLLPLIDTTPAG